MKNLKKAFAVVVALAMVMSTVAFAAVFSDVDDSAAYAEAIEAGVALKMFTGYEDGTFKPEGDITRAEFAAIVVRMLGQEAQADGAKGVTLFDDVPSTHWAAGYINIVSNLGIVNGYGDGNFGPEDNVTYEQAVKMCVVALGYEPAAGGNYPVGYLTIAQQRGITTGVRGTSGAPINRGQVAQMAFNALDVPLMTQTGFGTYIEYVINDGTNNTDRKTLLSENLGIVKVKAMVTESYELSSTKKADLVKVKITNNYKTVYDDEFPEDREKDIYVGDTNIRSLVGYPVIAYIAYDEMADESVAMYVRKDLTGTDELTLASSDIDSVDTVRDNNNQISHYRVNYYPTEDARTTEKFTIDKDANIYVNGYKEEITVSNALGNFYGTATFALNDSTNTSEDYDTIYILDYENAVVDSVNMTAGRVIMKEGSSISFGSNNTNVSSTLYDEDGKEIEWSTLQENDILSIRKAKGNVSVNICTLVRNTVEGTITERSSEADPDLVEFRIGGEYYKVDNQLVSPNDLDLNYEGIFYLDIFGRIAHYEAQSSLTRNYAYVIDTGIHNAGFEDRLQIKAFTFDGEIVTFTCAQNVTVIKEKADKTSTETEYYKKDDMDDLKDLIAVDSVITFSVNSQGEINRLALPGTNTDIGLNYFSKYAEGPVFDYRGNSGSIRVGGKSVEISDDTIIMIAGPGFTEDDYDLLSLSVLGEEDNTENVTTKVFDVNKNMVAGLVVIGGFIDVAGASSGLAMVSRISQIRDDDGAVIDRLTLFQSGETKEVNVQEAVATPALFSVIAPRLNAKGMMSSASVIASINNDKVEVGSGFANSVDVEYVIGKVVAKRGNRLTVTGYDGALDNVTDMIYSIPNSANVYMYNHSMSSNSLKAKIVDDVNIFEVEGSDYFNEYGDEIDNVDVLIRWYEGRIQDVVLFFDIDVEIAD